MEITTVIFARIRGETIMATKKDTTGKKELTGEEEVKVHDLPEPKKEVTTEEGKEVKGGRRTQCINN